MVRFYRIAKEPRASVLDSMGQTTIEYLLIAAMLTGCFIAYPLMMQAYDSYLNSIFFILNLALQ